MSTVGVNAVLSGYATDLLDIPSNRQPVYEPNLHRAG